MIRTILTLLVCLVGLSETGAQAQTVELQSREITQWKSVYGEVEPKDLIPARARIGGTLVTLSVSAGDRVEEGQEIARVEDDKLNFSLAAIDAQLAGLHNQLDTAQSDLDRGVSLSDRGVITAQRFEQLQTQVDVLKNQILSTEAERLGIEQRVTEGAVTSPVSGIVLSVPVAKGSVINPGETVARVAGGGVFLRLALPERHAGDLKLGDTIRVGQGDAESLGTLVKIYPLIEGGRVLADVDVPGLDDRFVGRRVPVRLPLGTRQVLAVPQAAVIARAGLDFVAIETTDGVLERTVVPGQVIVQDGATYIEILSGLRAGDQVVTGHE